MRSIFFAILVSLLLAQGASAQRVRIEGRALAGEPFGVGWVTVPLSEESAQVVDHNSFAIVDPRGRALYPTFNTGRFRRLVGRVIGGLTGEHDLLPPNQVTAHFLFTGREPLELTVYTPEATALSLAVEREDREHGKLLDKWWKQYHITVRAQRDAGDYPPLVETYLTNMLGARLGLRDPLLTRLQQEKPAEEPYATLELLLGTEDLRDRTMRETLSGASGRDAPAAGDPPPPIDWPTLPAAGGDLAAPPIEPLALQTPENWLYLRFGNFTNYLWFQRLLDDQGGDLGRLLTLRGHNPQPSKRFQQQIALETNILSEVVGPQVVRDVAIVGRDTYLREGAAMGILFHARNNDLLRHDIAQQRTAAQRRLRDAGAEMRTERIAGHEVSLLTTPDNRLRSIYARRGDFHLVTNCRAMAEQFVRLEEGRGALGTTPEFAELRRRYPLEREDTLFVYLSTGFFRGLIEPQYQIELARRLTAVTDLELVQLARLAAHAEQRRGATLEDLVAGRFLPADFLSRPDRAHPRIEGEEVTDSLRGRRGTFLPIPDTPLGPVTAAEARACAERSAYYRDTWRRMDPLVVAVRRYQLNDSGLERLKVEAEINPFESTKYGWITSLIGEPTRRYLVPPSDQAIFVQAMVQGGSLDPAVPPHHMFLGLADRGDPLPIGRGGLLDTMRLVRAVPGYLGAWPELGWLDLFSFGPGSKPDALGYSTVLPGVFRRQWEGFSVTSFHRDLLAGVDRLRFAAAEKPAQARFVMKNLEEAEAAVWINGLAYYRAEQASFGNIRLLHALSQQLQVRRERALGTAERLLDTELVCSLGGKYEVAQHRDGLWQWNSTRRAGRSPGDWTVPEDYRAPLLDWLRGAEGTLVMEGDRLLVEAEVDMQRAPREPKIELPNFFDFFQRPRPPAEERRPAEEKPAGREF